MTKSLNPALEFSRLVEDDDERKKKTPSPEAENPALEFSDLVKTPEGEARSVIERITSGLARGYYGSQGSFYNKLANSFMVYRDTAQSQEPEKGFGEVDSALITALTSAEEWARGQAETFFAEEPKPKDAGMLDTAAEMIGAAPLQIGQAVAEMAVGGPALLGASSALSAADQGPGAAAVAGATGYGAGAMVRALPGVPAPFRPAADLAASAAGIHAAGGGVKEQAIAAGLAGLGYRQGTKRKIRNVTTKAGNINLAYLDTPENIKSALQVVAREEGEFLDARRGVRTHEATLEAAQAMGIGADELLQRRKGQAFNAEEAVRTRQILVGSAEDLVAHAKKVAEGGTSEEDQARFLQSYMRHVAIQEQASGMTAEAGRALESFKIKAKADKARAEAVKTIVRDYAGGATPEELASMIAAIDTPEGVAKFTRGAFKAKTGDKLLELWMNGLLSGPQTHIVNAGSNSLVALYSAVPETLVSAGYGALRGGDRVLFRESIAKLNGMKRGVMAGLRLAGQTFKEKEGFQYGPVTRDPERRKAIGGLAGKIIRLPGRALDAEDVFFKVVNYSGEIEALAVRQATKEGLNGDALKVRVAQLLENPPDDMSAAAWKVAETNTFTNDLGKFGKWLQGGIAQHKQLRILMPFVRTPLNILNYGAKRIPPIALAMPSTWKALKAGGIERDQAMARLTIGSLTGGAVALLASEGTITGGGPSDKAERDAVYRTGWQPYSIKIGDRYHSYARFEPIGSIIGTWADFAETRELMTEGEASEIASKIAFGVGKNFISKSYMQGLSNFIEAVHDPSRYGERYIGNLLGSIVPTGVAQATRIEDAYLRDAQSIMDSVKMRIPGLRKTIPIRLNLWGQEMKTEGGLGPDFLSPIYISTDKNDPVADEMLNIRYFPAMPPRQIGGVDLDQNQYWEYVKMAGKPAKEALDQIVTGSRMGRLLLREHGFTKDWSGMNNAAKEAVMRKVIEDHRRGASQMILAKYPKLIKESIKRGIDPFTQPAGQ